MITRGVSTHPLGIRRPAIVLFMMALLAGTLVVVAPPAHATHVDCDYEYVNVYCNLTVRYDDADNTMLIKGTMAGWRRGTLHMEYKVFRNGNLVWSEDFSPCYDSTECVRSDYFFNCRDGDFYEVEMHFWSNHREHKLRDRWGFRA